MDKEIAESGNAPVEWDKANSFSLGLKHAGIIWSMKTLQLDYQPFIGLILQYSYLTT